MAKLDIHLASRISGLASMCGVGNATAKAVYDAASHESGSAAISPPQNLGTPSPRPAAKYKVISHNELKQLFADLY